MNARLLLILAFWSNWPIIGNGKTKGEEVREREEEEIKIRRSIIVKREILEDTDNPLVKKLKFSVGALKAYKDWYISNPNVKGLSSSGLKVYSNLIELGYESHDGKRVHYYQTTIQVNLAYEIIITISGEKGAYDIGMPI